MLSVSPSASIVYPHGNTTSSTSPWRSYDASGPKIHESPRSKHFSGFSRSNRAKPRRYRQPRGRVPILLPDFHSRGRGAGYPGTRRLRNHKELLKIVAAEEPIKSRPGFVAPAAVISYLIRLQASRDCAGGLKRLLIETGLFTIVTIEALRTYRHKVAVDVAVLHG